MKLKLTLMSMSLVALGACMSGTTMKEPTVVDPIVGKRLVGGDGTVFTINADGTMGGTLGGETVVGSYNANATETCSTFTAPERLVGREFCSVPMIDGDTVVFNRRDGSKSQAYMIES